jgi:hypothetical protein
MDSVTFLPSMSYVRPLWSICVRTQRGEMSPARARHNTMAHNQARRCAAHNCKAALHHARADGFSSRSTQLYSARARALVMRHCPGVEPAAPNTTLGGEFSGRSPRGL